MYRLPLARNIDRRVTLFSLVPCIHRHAVASAGYIHPRVIPWFYANADNGTS